MGLGFEITCTFSGKWKVSRRNQGLSGIIYKEFLLLIVTPSFHICTSQEQFQKEYMTIQRRPTLLPSPEASQGDTWTRSLLADFLTFNPRQYELNYHKQCLLIVTKFHLISASNYKFHAFTIQVQPHTPFSKAYSLF